MEGKSLESPDRLPLPGPTSSAAMTARKFFASVTDP
jgi:hypothetical protein